VNATAERWYDRDPARLEWELEEFERNALRAEVAIDKERRLTVKTEALFRGEPVEITATYPHSYPFFPPTVVGAARILDRHQDPIGLNYCLLENPSRDWHPGRSVGALIGKNLRNLLADTEKGQAAIRAGEARMAEPESAFFPRSEKVVLVAEPFLTNELLAASGAMTIRRCAGRLRLLTEAAGQARLEDGELLERFPDEGGDISGRWVSIWGRPSAEDYRAKLLEEINNADPRILEGLARQLGRAKGLPFAGRVVGLTFLEQGPTRDEQRRNWLFVEIEKKRGYEPTLRRWPVETQALSRLERIRRLPELSGLEHARAIVVGAGSLGAPVAVELAKAGVGRLDIFDCDNYDVNNTVRHVLGGELAGEPKAEAVAAYCLRLNPFTAAHGHRLCVGDSDDAEALLDQLLAEATIVIDTTGATTVARYLAAKTSGAGVPFLVAGLTTASHGGDLFVVLPEGPSFERFLEAQREGGPIPSPPAGEPSEVTPIGCRDPAFTGAGFEATELAAITARSAIRATGLTDYPSAGANWIVVSFRSDPHCQEGRLEHGADSTT
jgi:molybdopterin/thiamine biosynthesis adenylyltransferase